MKKKILLSFAITLTSAALFFVSCKKSTTPTDNSGNGGANCTNVNIVITESVTNYSACPSVVTGSITVSASGSTGFTYNKNGGAYQSSNVFTGLASGTYTIGVKDANGCTNSKSVVVGEAAGPNFVAVRTIIRNNCGGSSCHLNGGAQRGYNFDNECDIVSSWSKIKSTCVTLQSMPTSGPLSSADQQAITTWVNNGHTYTN